MQWELEPTYMSGITNSRKTLYRKTTTTISVCCILRYYTFILYPRLNPNTNTNMEWRIPTLETRNHSMKLAMENTPRDSILYLSPMVQSSPWITLLMGKVASTLLYIDLDMQKDIRKHARMFAVLYYLWVLSLFSSIMTTIRILMFCCSSYYWYFYVMFVVLLCQYMYSKNHILDFFISRAWAPVQLLNSITSACIVKTNCLSDQPFLFYHTELNSKT